MGLTTTIVEDGANSGTSKRIALAISHEVCSEILRDTGPDRRALSTATAVATVVATFSSKEVLEGSDIWKRDGRGT